MNVKMLTTAEVILRTQKIVSRVELLNIYLGVLGFPYCAPYYSALQSHSHSVHTNIFGDYYLKSFASDMPFGLVDIYQRGLEGNTMTIRKRGTSCTVHPTIRGASLRSLSITVRKF
jgi:hypothetical protein